MIAAIILSYLECTLQILDGPDARLADYFDLMAGTSTGGLLTTMLTAPSQEENRPLFTATEAMKFYQRESPKIFPQSR